jgi:hypothetical protein
LKRIATIVLLSLLTACSTTQPSNNNQPNPPGAASQPTAAGQPGAASQPGQPAAAAKPIGELKEGEASGSILAEGETISLKYAYAGHTEMFGEPAVSLLLTEMPVEEEALAKYFDDKYGSFPNGSKGLRYKVGSEAFWVMYQPSSFQTSGINTLKDYSVENGIVKGRDEDTTEFSGQQYKRSVSFVARVREKVAK